MMKKLLSILLAAALIASLAVQALASYEVESGSMAASGMAVVDGVLYVADSWNNAVWQLEDGGGASPLAGRTDVKDSSGRPMGGYADGSFSASAFISSTVASTTLHTLSPRPRGSSAYRGTSWKSAASCSSITSYSAHTMGDDGLICASAPPRAPT